MIERSLHRALNGAIRAAEAGQRAVGHQMSEKVVSLAPATAPRGRILISHRLDGLFMGSEDPRRREHNQFSEVPALAEALVERGFAVDLVSWLRRHPGPRRRYDMLLGVRSNFDVLSEGLGPDCARVMLIETTHWLYNNHASLGRSLEVQQSRGVTPERDIELERNDAIENADYALMFGNDFVYGTFSFAGTPVFEIPNPAIHLPPWRDGKDYGEARRRFLWLGSRGLAHKGLGRVLEAFAGMPDHQQTVCGPLASEPRFCAAYQRELTRFPNIRPLGWIDVASPEFAALSDRAIAHVTPSCAEAQCGAVVNCMATGLIPMVSRQVGMDVDPTFGVLLEDDSVSGIQRAVRALSDLSSEQLAAMARRSWEIAHERHSIARYKQVVGDVVERILAAHPGAGVSGFVRLAEPGFDGLDAERKVGLS